MYQEFLKLFPTLNPHIQNTTEDKKREKGKILYEKKEEKKLLVPEKHLNNSIHNKNQIPSGLDQQQQCLCKCFEKVNINCQVDKKWFQYILCLCLMVTKGQQNGFKEMMDLQSFLENFLRGRRETK